MGSRGRAYRRAEEKKSFFLAKNNRLCVSAINTNWTQKTFQVSIKYSRFYGPKQKRLEDKGFIDKLSTEDNLTLDLAACMEAIISTSESA